MNIFNFFKTTRTTYSSMNEGFDKLNEIHTGINEMFDSIEDNLKAINASFDNIEDNLKFNRENVCMFINLSNQQFDQGYTFTKSLRWDDPKVLSKLKELFELSQDTEIVGLSIDSDGISLNPKIT